VLDTCGEFLEETVGGVGEVAKAELVDFVLLGKGNHDCHSGEKKAFCDCSLFGCSLDRRPDFLHEVFYAVFKIECQGGMVLCWRGKWKA